MYDNGAESESEFESFHGEPRMGENDVEIEESEDEAMSEDCNEVSGNTIVMYMSFLHEMLRESNMLHMIGFVDSSVTGALGCGNSTERSRSLSDAFKRGKPSQIFLVPYNSGDHWILTVVSPTEDLVYYMDPSKRRMDVTTDEWKTIGIPEQLCDKTCEYFIMLYMREIVLDKNQDWSKKWLTRGDAYYTMENVDVVRQEWAKYVLKFTNNYQDSLKYQKCVAIKQQLATQT
ncbi:hypothetical protein ACLB2K_073156 [Fragaria x ananassa]